MRLSRLAVVLGAAVLATACQTPPGSSGSSGLGGLSSALGALGAAAPASPIKDMLEGAAAATKDYTAEDQRKLGTEFSAVLLGARPLLRNDLVQRYVNQVGYWVAMQAERPKDKDGREINFAWRFGVIDSEAVNAYATPGGFVFVTVGLLRKLNSESELAGVLGHEIAHVVQGHYLAAIKKGGFTQLAGGVVQAKAGNTAVNAAMVNAVRNIYAKGLDRTDEFDADRQGLLYATRAGYAPNGLPAVLRMYAASGSSNDMNFQLLFSTHPNPAERASRLDPLVAGKFARTPRVSNESRYEQIKRLIR
ncbi:MAG TPA: M48 family metalloprotease [Burkholderiaceae bacterium]|nr:M48 family metalloprotease [Burkholderiaceae bacterium]